MVHNCSVVTCKKVEMKGKNISFHSFPFKFPNVLAEWVARVNRMEKDGQPWKPRSWSKVCGVHFLESDYYRGPNQHQLREEAVPSQLLDPPQNHKRKKADQKYTMRKHPAEHQFATLAEGSMDVFCEFEGESKGEQEVASDVRLEYAQDDDIEEDVSFEITENDVPSESEEESADVSKTELMEPEGLKTWDTLEDPTETLQKVLRDSQSSNLSIGHVKREPEEEGTDDFADPRATVPVLLAGPSKPDHSPVASYKRPGPASSKSLSVAKSGQEVPKKPQLKRKPGRRTKKAKNAPKTKEPSSVIKTECLVCCFPCNVTIDNDVPRYPFCDDCITAYGSTNYGQKRKVKKKCLNGGLCKTNRNLPKQWCAICHINKFTNILDDMNLEFDFSSLEIKESSQSSNKRRKLTSKSKDEGETIMMNDALGNSSSVLLQRLSAEELAGYGIEMERSVKAEPMDFDGNAAHSSRISPSSGRPQNQAIPRTNKGSKKPNAAPNNKQSRSKKMISAHRSPDSDTAVDEDMSKKKEPSPKKQKEARVRKVLLEYSSSENEDTTYSLPAVNAGSDVLSKASTEATKKKNQSATTNNQNQNEYTEVLESIKVYVFTCGHACGLCNSTASKEWLKESGFYTAKPVYSPGTNNPSSTSSSASVKSTSAHKKNIPSSNTSLTLPALQKILKSAKSMGGNIKIQMTAPPTQKKMRTGPAPSRDVSSTAKPATAPTSNNLHSQNSHQPITQSALQNLPIAQMVSPSTNSINNENINTASSIVQSKPGNTISVDLETTITGTAISPLVTTGNSTRSVTHNVSNISTSQLVPIAGTTTPVIHNDTTVSFTPQEVPNIVPTSIIIQNSQNSATLQNVTLGAPVVWKSILPNSLQPKNPTTFVSRTVAAKPLQVEQFVQLQQQGHVLSPIQSQTAGMDPNASSAATLSQATASGQGDGQTSSVDAGNDLFPSFTVTLDD